MADATVAGMYFICNKRCSVLWNPNLLMTISAGTLWSTVTIRLSDIPNSPEHRRTKIKEAMEDGKPVLQKHPQTDVIIPKEEFPAWALNDITEEDFSLLSPISKDESRLAVYNDDSWLTEGRQLQENDRVNIKGVPSVPPDVWGTIRYKGPLSDSDQQSIQFGIELAEMFKGSGANSGVFRQKRYFTCAPNCALFLPLFYIRRREEVRVHGALGPVSSTSSSYVTTSMSDIDLWSDRGSMSSELPPQHDMMTPPLSTAEFARLPISVSERVIWFSDHGEQHGTVKWIGKIPDLDPNATDAWYAGVDFDRPIGRGTGRYLGRQLFTAKKDHASLVPLVGLYKLVDDQRQQMHSVAPVAFVGPSSSFRTNDAVQLPNTTSDFDVTLPKAVAHRTSQQDPDSTLATIQSDPTIGNLSLRSTNDIAPVVSGDYNTSENRFSIFGSQPSTQDDDETNPKSSGHTTEATARVQSLTSSELNQTHLTEVETEHGRFCLGDSVQVALRPPRYGVIRWIGRPPSMTELDGQESGLVMVGLEMEVEDMQSYTDGSFEGVQVFNCAHRRAFFIYIKQCRLDTRNNDAP